jgi:plasmid stabilization system protein ParE
LLPLAENDLERLENFLLERSPKAAVRAARAIREAVLSLDENAERGPMVSDRGTRELAVRFGRNGYVVQYRVLDELVIVARIFHVRERR